MGDQQQVEPSIDIDDEDRRALLDVVRHFAGTQVAPLAERPERPMGGQVVDELLSQMRELGLISVEDVSGFGLWDFPDRPLSCGLSVELLAAVAEVSTGLACAAHTRAVASVLDRQSGVTGQRSVVSAESAAGLGGRLMGVSLTGEDLDSEEREALGDVWGPPRVRPRLVVAPDGWDALWWLQWSAQRGWAFARGTRATVFAEHLPHAHGLDELGHWLVATDDAEAYVRGESVVDALGVHSLGLLVIATSTAQRSIARARAFSTTRRQGGHVIAHHDAVAQLLARAEHAVLTSQALIAHLATMPPGLVRLRDAWRARAQCHPLLTAAGNDALQVLGGLGYMRDVGAERDQRDLNSLRLLGGSPTELTLRCAGLDTSRVSLT